MHGQEGLQLFQYAVFYEPLEGDEDEEVELIEDVTTVLAVSIDQAQTFAARQIPAEYMDRLDRVTVVVRPFLAQSIWMPPPAIPQGASLTEVLKHRIEPSSGQAVYVDARAFFDAPEPPPGPDIVPDFVPEEWT